MKGDTPVQDGTDVRETVPASDMTHVVVAFDDNRLIGDLFGQFDQNLALLERRLGIEAVGRGNQVIIKGGHEGCEQARLALEALYQRLQQGHELHPGDVEGAIRMASTEAGQLSLPTLEPRSRLAFAQISTKRKTIVARTPAQDAYIRAMDRADLVFGIGPAGTGKTFLAVSYAAALLERGEIDRIILSRPAVEAGERLGFLPGDMKEKVDPYLRPLYDALYEMMPGEKVERGMLSGVIEVAPLAFMRGRTLQNAVVILDEAQNTTAMQMKMFLTRLGDNAKMIVTGDPSQVDLPRGMVSGLREALEVLEGVEGITRVRFTEKDVVRHELVARIVAAYDKAGAAAGEAAASTAGRTGDGPTTPPRRG
ncbi:phosphate starvation-inducible protein PhoH [Breoghania corrubedonensis]|uniref:PhoH-like protein n=2 Tax=Breoghania corrubedonensis TaxID=665038 RepID=A0A2T5VGY7_9HYPH|nr:PhoH family protein [Breoghania corrubedonensis]PTW63017.1 phosphate starvation-inducible protein PhoH [Breoghania corrubedonensis]